jgi:hypothetical protein
MLRVGALSDLDQRSGKPVRSPSGRTAVSVPGGIGANPTERRRRPVVATRAADTAVVKEGAGRRVQAGKHDKWARAMSADSEP